jgi:hypothetical protein
MKADERQFALALLRQGWREGDPTGTRTYEVITTLGLPPKRAWYLLGKWTAKGWYSYGGSIDHGWLTADGAQMFRSLVT